MKKTLSIIACTVAAFTITTYSPNASTVSNDTGMSSMYGVNGQFEHYHETFVNKPSMYKRAIQQKTFQLTTTKQRLQKVAALMKR